MSRKVLWGIISTANIGRNKVIPAIHKAVNSEVVAVASRNLERARAFAAETNIPTAYGSYEELIADPNVDAIYNPLPNSEHAKWSIACAEAGKPVLCEKPLASNAAEAQEMVDAFTSRGVLFAEGFMYRFHPQSQKVKEMVDSGAIGDVMAIDSTFCFNIAGREDNIRLNKELAGGSLMDVGCYCVNLMRFITGEEPNEFQAVARLGARSGVDERFAGVLGFPSGIVGHFDSGLRAELVNRYDIRGTAGRITAEIAFVPDAVTDTILHYWHGAEHEKITIPAADQYQLMVEDFGDALLNNRPPRFAGQDGVENMVALDRLYEAAGIAR
jgi:xylose dehydrogenase (NAD/NADP)